MFITAVCVTFLIKGNVCMLFSSGRIAFSIKRNRFKTIELKTIPYLGPKWTKSKPPYPLGPHIPVWPI